MSCEVPSQMDRRLKSFFRRTSPGDLPFKLLRYKRKTGSERCREQRIGAIKTGSLAGGEPAYRNQQSLT